MRTAKGTYDRGLLTRSHPKIADIPWTGWSLVRKVLAEARKPVQRTEVWMPQRIPSIFTKSWAPEKSHRDGIYQYCETCGRTDRSFTSWWDVAETFVLNPGVSPRTKETSISQIASQLRLDLLASASSLGLSWRLNKWTQALDCAVYIVCWDSSPTFIFRGLRIETSPVGS